jgi:multiple sugar transport system substrate-binding protein
MRRLPRILLALPLALLLVTAGCGGGGDASPRTTIVYWANPETATSAAHEKLLRPLLDEFTDETGIAVDLKMQDWTKVYPKIITGIATHTMPDVFDIGSTWSAALDATGGLMPFDKQALAAIGGRDKFLAASLASAGVPGPDVAAVPLYGQTYALFYNTKLFAAAGIAAPPTTWRQFVADARKLTADGRWGVAWPGNAPLLNVHQAFIMGRQSGARLFSSTGRPQFDTPAERTAIQRMLDLRSVDKVVDPDMLEKAGPDAVAAFAQGRTGMLIQQSAAVGMLRSLHFKDYAVAEVPVLDPLPAGGRPVQSMVAGSNLAISADSKHRAADLKLVTFLTSPRAQTALNKAFGTVPVLKSLQGSPEFSDPATATFGKILARYAEPMPLVPAEGAMETVLGVAMTKLWSATADGRVSDAQIGAALRGAQQSLPGQ